MIGILNDPKLRYITVGGISFLAEYLIFIGINTATSLVIVANIISFLCGFAISFTGHKKWAFKGDHKYSSSTQFLSYALLAAINIVLGSFLIGIMVSGWGILPGIAKIVSMVLIMVWNFTILSRLIFRS